MNRPLLGCALIAAGIVGLTLALAGTALVIDEIHYLRSLPMPTPQPVRTAPVRHQFEHHPDPVPRVEIMAGLLARPDERFEERPVHGHRHLRPPAAQQRYRDLQLRHQPLRARRTPVRTANDVGEGGAPPSSESRASISERMPLHEKYTACT